MDDLIGDTPEPEVIPAPTLEELDRQIFEEQETLKSRGLSLVNPPIFLMEVKFSAFGELLRKKLGLTAEDLDRAVKEAMLTALRNINLNPPTKLILPKPDMPGMDVN